MEITCNQCGGLLAKWLSNECSPENAKTLAKNIGYNDSPFFGAKKKRTKFIGELVMVNVAVFPPAEIGLNVTITFWLSPAVIVKEVGCTANSPSLEEMVLTTRSEFPSLDTTNAQVDELSTCTSPKS